MNRRVDFNRDLIFQKFDLYNNPGLDTIADLKNHLKGYLRSLGIYLTPSDIEHRSSCAFEHYKSQPNIERWNCMDYKHHPRRDETLTFNQTQNGFFAKVVKNSPILECIDFRGLVIDRNLVDTIVKYTKNLKCVHFDINDISVNDWETLVRHIAPQLEHLSIGSFIKLIDNNDPSYDPLIPLFSSAKQLKGCSITFYPNSDITARSIKSLSKTTKQLEIYNWVNDGSNARGFIEDLVNAKFDGLNHFLIKSYTGDCNIDVAGDLKKFIDKNGDSLKAFHLNLVDLESHYWAIIENMRKLNDLTLEFNHSKANPVFDDIIQFPSINILNLKNFQLDLSGIETICKAFPNIQLLKMENGLFADFNPILEYMERFKNLKNLEIAYTKPKHPRYKLSDNCSKSLCYVLEHCSSLCRLALFNLARIHKDELKICKELADQNQVEFVFIQ